MNETEEPQEKIPDNDLKKSSSRGIDKPPKPSPSTSNKPPKPSPSTSEKPPKPSTDTPERQSSLLRKSSSRLTSSVDKQKLSSKSEELKKENESLKSKIEELEAQVSSLSDGRQALLSSSDAWKQQEENYKMLLKESKAKTDSVIEENESLRKELKDIQKKYEKESENLREDNELLKNQMRNFDQRKQDIIEEYEDRLAILSDDVELLTIDKEMISVKYDTLQKEHEALTMEFELLESFKNSIEEKRELRNQDLEDGEIPQSIDNEDYRILVAQNERLKAALVKLTELSTNEKQEYEKTQEEMQRLILIEIPSLEEKNYKLEEQLLDYEEQIDLLKLNLDESKDLQDQFEDLLEVKMDLEDEIGELRRSLAELEALRDLSEELEEAQQETEKQLRAELYQKEVYILDQESVINNLNVEIDGLNKKLERLSVHIKEQISTIEDLKEALNEKIDLEEAYLNIEEEMEEEEYEGLTYKTEAKEPSSPAHDVLQSILQREASKMAMKQLTANTKEIESRQAKYHLDLVSKFLPEAIIAKEFDMIQFILSMRRIHEKSLVGIDFITERYGMDIIERDLGSSEEKSEPLDELLAMVIRIRTRLVSFSTYAAYFIELFRYCDEETYLKLGKMYHEMSNYEKKVDLTLQILQKDDLKQEFPLDDIDIVLSRFKHLHSKFCFHIELPPKLFYTLKNKEINTKAIECIQNALMIAHKNGSRPYSIKGLRAIVEFNKRVTKRLSRKEEMIFSNGSKETFDAISSILNRIVVYSQEVLDLYVNREQTDIETVGDSLKEELLATLDEESGNLSTLSEAKALKLTEPIDIFVVALTRALYLFDESLPKGVYDSDEVKLITTCKQLEIRSKAIKEEIEASIMIKEKLEDAIRLNKEQEEAIQAKVKEIESLEWKNSEIEHQISQLQKSEESLKSSLTKLQEEYASKQFKFDDAISDLQYQLDTVIKEKQAIEDAHNELKEVHENFEQQLEKSKDLQAGISSMLTSSKKIEELKGVIKYLKTKNVELTDANSRFRLQHLLPPLHVEDRVPTRKLAEANKEIEMLVDTVSHKLATPIAVNLSDTSKKPMEQLEALRFEEKKLFGKLKTLREKALENLQDHMQGSKQSDLGSFPETLFTKRVHKLLNVDTKPIAKVSIPCKMDENLIPQNPIQISVTPNELMTIHSAIVQ